MKPASTDDSAQAVEGVLIVRRLTSVAARLRTFSILIDGSTVGTIADGEVKHFYLARGNHTLRLKVDWLWSETEFCLDAERRTVDLVCRASFRSPLDPFLRRKHYIEFADVDSGLAPQRSLGQDMALRMPIAVGPAIVLAIVLAAEHVGIEWSVVSSIAWILLSTGIRIPIEGRSPKARIRTR